MVWRPSDRQTDESILNKKSNGVVDNTIIFQNERGGQTIKTKIREHKIPQIGDKFSSRHGQKGDHWYDVWSRGFAFYLEWHDA